MDQSGFQDSQPYSQGVCFSFVIISLRIESVQFAVHYFLIDGVFEVVWLLVLRDPSSRWHVYECNIFLLILTFYQLVLHVQYKYL